MCHFSEQECLTRKHVFVFYMIHSVEQGLDIRQFSLVGFYRIQYTRPEFVITASADVLAPAGAKPSAGTSMTTK